MYLLLYHHLSCYCLLRRLWSEDRFFKCQFLITGASTSRSSSSNDFRSALNYLDVTPHDVVFRIHFNNDVHKITVPNTATVGELKAKICEKTAVPVCRQALKGWEPGKQVGHVVFRNVLCKLILSIVERITKFLDGAQVAQYRQRGQFSPIRHDRRGFHG